MTTIEGAIHFHYLTDPFYFPNRNKLKTFLQQLSKKNGYDIDTINYIFCSDEYLLKVNQEYLKHNTYTDIITFQLSQKGQPLLSDIYISVDRVRENASVLKNTFSNELHRVIFHGLLHLCGFKDKSSKDVTQMRTEEDQALQSYFVSRGTLQ